VRGEAEVRGDDGLNDEVRLNDFANVSLGLAAECSHFVVEGVVVCLSEFESSHGFGVSITGYAVSGCGVAAMLCSRKKLSTLGGPSDAVGAGVTAPLSALVYFAAVADNRCQASN
jgi:hypothetical protein